MQQESRLQSFLNNPARAMWSMALPIIAGMMVQTLFNVVDIMFIGWLGADEVTAIETRIAAQITESKTPTATSGVPW